jgi:hypothetical protein
MNAAAEDQSAGNATSSNEAATGEGILMTAFKGQIVLVHESIRENITFSVTASDEI